MEGVSLGEGNKLIQLNRGLHILVVNEIDFSRDEFAREYITMGVEHERQVFEEQGIPNPEQHVSSYEEIVGTPKHPGTLDGSSYYFHIYLIDHGRLIGQSALEVLDDVPGIDGYVQLDYSDPTVSKSDAETEYEVSQHALEGIGSDYISLTPVEILLRFSQHVDDPEDVVARFTGGDIPEEYLRASGYMKAPVDIWFPPLNAGTPDEYRQIIENPDSIYGIFRGIPARLSREAADYLFVEEYLQNGFVNEEDLNEGLTLDALPCVVKTRESLDAVIQEHGHVPFFPIQ